LRQRSRMYGLSPRTVHSRRRPRQSASARSVWIRISSQRGSRPPGCSRPAKFLCEAGEQLPAAAPRTAPKAENRFHHSQKVQPGAPKGEYLRVFCFSPVASILQKAMGQPPAELTARVKSAGSPLAVACRQSRPSRSSRLSRRSRIRGGNRYDSPLGDAVGLVIPGEDGANEHQSSRL
jgi:hypothetical protein